MIAMAFEFINSVLLPITAGVALGFPAGAFAGWRARVWRDAHSA